MTRRGEVTARRVAAGDDLLGADGRYHRVTVDKPIPGDTASERVIFVLRKTTRGLQGDPHLTEALTRAFMFADRSVAGEIHVVGMQLTTMLTRALKGDAYVEGGEPTDDEIVTAMEVLLSDPNVRAVLFNVFGGITRCDEVARGIIEAVRIMKPTVPFVVRLDGTNDVEARKLLSDAALPGVYPEATMDGAAARVVELARETVA